MNLKLILRNIQIEGKRSGLTRALAQFLYYVLNQLICFRRLEIILLTRENLAPIDPARYSNFSSKLASLSDLLDMQSEQKWMITDELVNGFKSGDSCILSFIDGKRAGYTWIHDAGHPFLTPGLQITIPANYSYNFAGFTLPEYRGSGLQPFRHHSTLNLPEWKDKRGMIGFVEINNFSSKKGQSKSGYQPLGSITLIGKRNQFMAYFSRELRKLGIKRISK